MDLISLDNSKIIFLLLVITTAGIWLLYEGAIIGLSNENETEPRFSERGHRKSEITHGKVFKFISKEEKKLRNGENTHKYTENTTAESNEEKELKNVLSISVMTKRRKERFALISAAEQKPKTKRTPDVIGIGARKCGTGVLSTFLRAHPLIKATMHEMHFYDKNRERGLEYYKSQLAAVSEDELSFEKTPSYFISPPANLPEIIKNDCPGVKLILLLCEPAARAFSDFAMRWEKNPLHDTESFEEHIDLHLSQLQVILQNLTSQREEFALDKFILMMRQQRQTTPYGIGLYHLFLQRWLKSFGRDHLLVLDGAELLKNAGAVLEKVQDFLGLPKILKREDFVKHPAKGLYCLRPWWENYKIQAELQSDPGWEQNLLCSSKNKGRTRSRNSSYTLLPSSAKRLKEFYAPYNEKLFEMIGKKFSW